jgi:hypothetical protein
VKKLDDRRLGIDSKIADHYAASGERPAQDE